ncbi:hypothetical protein K439DRAFT_1623909 [Ramaria rubella]|nr:hypothetical protein K439DRAFT_1623909 [Ramaria rubella]
MTTGSKIESEEVTIASSDHCQLEHHDVATSRHGSGPAKITTLELTKIQHELQHSWKRFQHHKYQNSILIEKHRTLLAILECGVCNETMCEPCIIGYGVVAMYFVTSALSSGFSTGWTPLQCRKCIRAKPVITYTVRNMLEVFAKTVPLKAGSPPSH